MPRAGLSADVVVGEAARLVDELGGDRLTLAELAKRFGVAQPSLYKHVASVDGLHRLIALRVAREVGAALRRAATGRAREDAVHALAEAYRQYAHAHPGRYVYLVRAPGPDDTELRDAAADLLEVFADVLAGYGIPDADVVDAARFVRSTLHGFVSLELGQGFGLPTSVDRSYERLVAATHQALSQWRTATGESRRETGSS